MLFQIINNKKIHFFWPSVNNALKDWIIVQRQILQKMALNQTRFSYLFDLGNRELTVIWFVVNNLNRPILIYYDPPWFYLIKTRLRLTRNYEAIQASSHRNISTERSLFIKFWVWEWAWVSEWAWIWKKSDTIHTNLYGINNNLISRKSQFDNFNISFWMRSCSFNLNSAPFTTISFMAVKFDVEVAIRNVKYAGNTNIYYKILIPS